MELTSDHLAKLVAAQLKTFRISAALDRLRPLLVRPYREDRTWEYADPEHLVECWIIAELDGNLGLAYSLQCHSPDQPWGVIYTDVTDNCGPDICWHDGLEGAYIGAGQFDGPLPDGYEWA